MALNTRLIGFPQNVFKKVLAKKVFKKNNISFIVIPKHRKLHGRVAQRIRRPTSNRKIVGSNPIVVEFSKCEHGKGSVDSIFRIKVAVIFVDVNVNISFLFYVVHIPCGLVARIRHSHRRGRGSIPRTGEFQFMVDFMMFFDSFSYYNFLH